MNTPAPSVEQNEEWKVPGMTLVSGVAIGKAFFLGTSPLQVHELTLPQEEVEHEIHRYYKALNRSKSDIVALEQEVQGKQGQQEISSILQAHLEIIKDPILTEEVVNTIRKDRKNAEYVFSSVMGKIEESLTAVQEGSLAVDRVQDIHDISNRVIGHLCCQHKSSLGDADQNLIVFSKELTPSEVASANPSYIRGFVSLVGAPTSHTAIVSRAKNIPYLANFSQENWERIQEYSGKLVLVDGIRGEIIFNPKSKTLENCYKQKNITYSVKSYPQASPHALVSSHATSLEEVRMLSEFFPQTSIGLFRSEFLAIAEDRLPTEEEQAAVYKSLALFPERVSVLRLFDFGEDKLCPGRDPIQERSVRYLLKNPQILDDQLRAILTASASGPLKVLIPGTADVIEIIEVKRRLENIRRAFNKDHYIENIAWGSMIEIPSAVLMIDEILQECDFISIGTNDLMQYALGNNRETVLPDYLDNPLHPSVMRMIRHVVSNAKQRDVYTSICGEAAANLSLTPFFLGLGVQELSVAMPAIVELRERIASLNLSSCVEHTEKLLRARTCEEVQALLA
ncbi:phosphoenolpyruvate--protein phosphotransferase [Chlamydia caviae]|uniref:Phosphoenolpyruvate-protein phosphotransferase n=1 Tax=Chlamydia caviae (strain ATCC VR-813 / DSM 19441 / 03DC25 / GPIC) TaxID=227941 RepID=Q823S7_CHLCV|nr:phosphoenolpyruvate--protein phosphotransferase [Chlamydia caviae]AAP05077.1 phosphoenolpyruvate-protein phosphotransferase [Chlamydia caviae GPIC]